MNEFNKTADYKDLINFLSSKSLSFSAVVIITDTVVSELYLDKIKKFLIQNISEKTRVGDYIVPTGEQYKTREIKSLIEDYLLENNYDKKTCLIALGGGVITDLVGFVAATYLRGVSVVYIPTTLLAMVDASMGGKTAVNTSHGKNLIGCFKQPDLVVLESLFLTTLPEQEYIAAFAEIIKHAIIADQDYFKFLQTNYKILLARDNSQKYFDIINYVIARSIEIKAGIVSQDEKETSGVRHQLNFGHTIGHAIEAASDYKISHGYAVALGIMIESMIAVKKKLLKVAEFRLISRVLKYYKLDESISNDLFSEDFINVFLQRLMHDKKNTSSQVKMIMIKSVGECYANKGQYTHAVELNFVKNILNELFVREYEQA